MSGEEKLCMLSNRRMKYLILWESSATLKLMLLIIKIVSNEFNILLQGSGRQHMCDLNMCGRQCLLDAMLFSIW